MAGHRSKRSIGNPRAPNRGKGSVVDERAQARARLFANGRSQAVRLPKAFRFPGAEVFIRREGDAVILEPIPDRTWPDGYWAAVDAAAEDLAIGRIDPLGGLLLDLEPNDV